MTDGKVDDYIARLDADQAAIVTRLRTLIQQAAPHAQEAFKWAQPVYEQGGPFCYIKAFKNAVNFGFWRGVDLTAPVGLLQGSGEKMRHIKVSNPDDIVEPLFADLVRQAVDLNAAKGDPTKGA